MTRRLSPAIAAIAICCALALGAVTAVATGAAAAVSGQAGPPGTLAGLNVTAENVSSLLRQNTQPVWVDHVHFYTLRSGKELEGTLEIAQFKSNAPWGDSSFDLSIAQQLGQTVPLVVRLDGVRVYLSSTRGLAVAAWFRNGHFYMLNIRKTYTRPRELIRAALAVNG